MCNTGSVTTHSHVGGHTAEPVDAVIDRLNDPTVAASLVTLLDNAELLSTLVLGLSGFVERGDMIMDSVAESVNEFKGAATSGDGPSLPPLSELSATAGMLASSAPTLSRVLDSPMTSDATIDLLAMMSEAATEGAATAKANGTTVEGPVGAYRALKDPHVQKGMGLLIEIARSLGRRM